MAWPVRVLLRGGTGVGSPAPFDAPYRCGLLDGLGGALVKERALKTVPAKRLIDAIRASVSEPVKEAPARKAVAKEASAKKPAATKKPAVKKTIAKKPEAAKKPAAAKKK